MRPLIGYVQLNKRIAICARLVAGPAVSSELTKIPGVTRSDLKSTARDGLIEKRIHFQKRKWSDVTSAMEYEWALTAKGVAAISKVFEIGAGKSVDTENSSQQA